MKVIAGWMKLNGSAVQHVQQLPENETASVPATSNNNTRYLFAIPAFKNNGKYDADRLPATDTVVILHTTQQPKTVTILGSGKKLSFDYNNAQLTIQVPAAIRTDLVDVIKVELKK